MTHAQIFQRLYAHLCELIKRHRKAQLKGWPHLERPRTCSTNLLVLEVLEHRRIVPLDGLLRGMRPELVSLLVTPEVPRQHVAWEEDAKRKINGDLHAQVRTWRTQ